MMEAIYRVVGKGPGHAMYQEEFEEIFAKDFDGIENGSHLRECLQGQPKIKGLCGPMYDGEHMGYPVVRYESWAVYDMMSK
jgi:hypothetical protein